MDVPNVPSWPVVVVGKLITAPQGGVSVRSEDRPIGPSEYGILKTSSVTYGEFDAGAHKTILADELDRARIQPRRDHIIFSRMNTSALVGASAYIDCDHEHLFLPDRLWQFTAKDSSTLSTRWLAYWLGWSNTRAEISGRASGTSASMKNISMPKLLGLELALPPIAEQTKIAEILSSVDEAIQATQAVIDQTRKVKQGLLQQLLTRGIGHTRFKQTEIGEIPESWDVVELSDLTERITKGESPRWQGFEYQDHGVLFVTSENVRDRFLALESPKFIPAEFADKLARSTLIHGDVLVNIVGASIGRAALYDLQQRANVNQAVAVIRLVSERVLPRLVLEALYSDRGQSYLGLNQVESARPNVSLGSLRKFPMQVPPIAEQHAIVERAVAVDLAIEAGMSKERRLLRLKAGLMADLLSGRVRVQVPA